MESPHGLLLVALIATSAIIHLVRAQDPEGFISLDCGLPPNEVSPYIHPGSGLTYSSDSAFIQSGKIGRIEKKLEETYKKMVWTLRYFPDGKRNCYSFNVKQGTNYLIRVRFVYGNYDGDNNNPIFDLHIGPNFWLSMDLGDMKDGSTLEDIIHTPRSNFLDVCLVKTGTSTPFISSLELRPLPNNSYITTSGSLRFWTRYYITDSKAFITYPGDAYDRLWIPYLNSTWKKISTTLKANNTGSFNLPQVAVTTAATPANASEPLIYTDFLPFPNDKIFFFLHFSEVQVLGANETREFDIFWNGKVISESFRPIYMQPKTVYNPYPVTCEEGKCVLELKKTRRSTLPPLLNAIEIYIVVDTPQSETNENDGMLASSNFMLVLTVRNIKATYGLNRITWQGDPCVPKQFLWDGLICNIVDTSTPPTITSLNLASSGLTGTIADGIQNLTYLEKLDLSNNSLTGVVPEYLANLKFLTLLNLSNNNLNGSIPQALRDREKKGLKIIFDGDDKKPCLSGSCKKKFPVLILIVVVASVIVVIIVVLVLVFVIKKRNASSNVEALPPSSTTPRENVTPTGISDSSIKTKKKRFSYSEVMEMTKNLQRPLGEGGFGVVYHGDLNGLQQVAVKIISQSSAQGYKEFKAEVELLLRVHHINLVSLVGYCDERDHLALIYEYMSNVDLKHHLSGKHGASVLSWSTRLRIAVDSALGLEYLHIGCRPSMVHRDVKSTNILLDEKFTAKIADFGLSRSFQLGEESHVSTVIAGTPGYLDPEYYRTGRLAEMSDVYSFGIVLLEIITNQRVTDHTREKSHITEWTAFMLNRGDITRIMDPKLNGEYNSRSVWRALELAMLCANPSSGKRPSMSQVVVELKECLISENLMKRQNQDMDSQSSLEMSMSFDTKDFPSAR
ncbi:putative receptor-like protein kinase At3g46340 isoform X2 [Eutrema salsugineum]|uniref:putative receptor-like protein kinase At3g46340 isoform X2 n=1 Tax=Eutrema salsugineum TaxID=72664 RepID=UPI000CECFE12|nr:putative receptor-like protein kinase At3g46340 isoform X2 [Eutrema salsugineum]